MIDLDKVDIAITTDTAQKVVCQMETDEIFDAIETSINNNNITRKEVFERICDDYKEELSELLRRFYNRNPDEWEATEHENQLKEWDEWIEIGIN